MYACVVLASHRTDVGSPGQSDSGWGLRLGWAAICLGSQSLSGLAGQGFLHSWLRVSAIRLTRQARCVGEANDLRGWRRRLRHMTCHLCSKSRASGARRPPELSRTCARVHWNPSRGGLLVSLAGGSGSLATRTSFGHVGGSGGWSYLSSGVLLGSCSSVFWVLSRLRGA